MPRQQVKKTYFNFTGGLNTEAGYLTFPPNQWKEGDNVIPQLDGSLHVRTAMNYETSGVLSSRLDSLSVKNLAAYSVHEWLNVGGYGGQNYVVVQRGRYLYFYTTATETISANELGATYVVDLDLYEAPLFDGVASMEPVQTVSANGKLIVVGEAINPILIEDTGTALVVTQLTLRYRDFEGVADGYADEYVDVEPAALTVAHEYNLYNQGWSATNINAYYTSQALYPSNSQQWFLGKNSSDVFDPTLLVKQDFGKSRAPRGRMILDVFLRDRDAASGLTGVTSAEEFARPRTCAFFAGRAWYAGISSDAINSWVLFSQVITSDANIGQCYQQNDPTSEHISDLLANDGGVVVIQGIGNILKLVAMDKALLVVADNGVWAIRGTMTDGFSATGYEIQQVTNLGCLSATSVTLVEDTVMFWSDVGIMSIIADPATGNVKAQNISMGVIATLYNDIPAAAKTYAAGTYDPVEKCVVWLYNDAPNADGTTDRFLKNRVLVMDLRLKAFYTHIISPLASNSPYMIAPFTTRGRSRVTTQYNIVDSGLVNVVNQYSQQIVENIDIVTGITPVFKVLTIVPSGSNFSVTFSQWEDGVVQAAKFKDWYDKDSVGAGYVGYILTGYDLGANQGGDRKLQTNYITVLMKRTETGIDVNGNVTNDSSVLLQGRWNFTDSSVANKWTTATQLYRHRRVFLPASLPSATFDDGYPVLVAKHKLRGRGNAFQLKFYSEAGKDFQLIGWSIPVLSNVD